MVRRCSCLLARDETHGFVFRQLLLAGFELFRHLLMLGTFSKSLEVVIDGTVQLVLDAARTRLELARTTGLYIAAKLRRKLVGELAI